VPNFGFEERVGRMSQGEPTAFARESTGVTCASDAVADAASNITAQQMSARVRTVPGINSRY
jgi:hypothetical protein